MDQADMRRRTKRFALQVISFTEALPKRRVCEVIGKQLMRSATSVGANYRAACRGRSTADFIAKLGIVLEEADESLYWMELLHESGAVDTQTLRALAKEANELVSIVAASLVTAKASKSRRKSELINLKS